MALNPDAPLFVPSRTYYSSPILYTNPNPNYSRTYLFYPYYAEFPQTCYQTGLAYWYQPLYSISPLMYHYYTVPSNNYIVPTAPPHRCSIVEIDEKQETGVDTDVTIAYQRNPKRGPVQKVSKSELWVSRNYMRMRKKLSNGRTPNLEINKEEDIDERTTIMIKNIPPEITKEYLLAMLHEHCYIVNRSLVKLQGTNEEGVLSEFDFFYLPIDFSTRGNLGYALVNFTSSIAVKRVHKHFQGYKWGDISSGKICRVNYSHKQGLDMLVKRANAMDLRGIPEECLPCMFEPACNGLNDFTEHLLGNRAMQ